MSAGFTKELDVAQVVLYAFWVFFAGLIYHLRQEDKREGYPLVSAIPGRTEIVETEGFPPMPPVKRFLHYHGEVTTSPSTTEPRFPEGAVPAAAWPGAPLEPTGNPLVDGLGPAAYAFRIDKPELTVDGKPKIAPLRVLPQYEVWPGSIDPRGFRVVGLDGVEAGRVVDIWVDEVEEHVRYFEVALTLPGVEGDHVLVPHTFTRIRKRLSELRVGALRARHFADIPRLREAETVTRREEDRLVGYFGGGLLYATPSRLGPLL